MIKPKSIIKLLLKGRIVPVYRLNGEGDECLVGYRRKDGTFYPFLAEHWQEPAAKKVIDAEALKLENKRRKSVGEEPLTCTEVSEPVQKEPSEPIPSVREIRQEIRKIVKENPKVGHE